MKLDGNKWIITVFAVCFTVLAVSSTTNAAVQYIFGAPEYTYPEGGGTPTLQVTLHRTVDTGETLSAVSVTLGSVCPTECPLLPGSTEATNGALADYTFTNPVVFANTIEQATVTIAINDDNEEEMREYFCLSVENEQGERGSQWFTRVIIPWNDHCVDVLTPQSGSDDETIGFDISGAMTAREGYVGPLSTTNSKSVSIEVTPESGGTGKDINIYLTTSPDYASFSWYGI
ncbi:uncharacterized protein, partial [Amphiura filiformis]|uniref:uncharacterized protein n=1 Tax=Amphiura filiformis TaxID=82378 RepID=UPI003B21B8A1